MVPNEDRKIEGLLERYFEGLTTLEEERILRDYFAGGGDLPGAEYAEAMFSYFADEAAGDGASDDDACRTLPAAHGRRPSWRGWAAASAAVVAGAAIALAMHRAPQTVYCYVDGRPVTDTREASLYTGRALRLVVESFAESAAPVRRLGGVFDIFVPSDAAECGAADSLLEECSGDETT